MADLDLAGRCEATTDGVTRQVRCGLAADGHDRHRAKTDFGELWWTAPQAAGKSWVSPVATTSANEDDAYTMMTERVRRQFASQWDDELAAAYDAGRRRGNTEMIEALRDEERYVAWYRTLPKSYRMSLRPARIDCADYLESLARSLDVGHTTPGETGASDGAQ